MIPVFLEGRNIVLAPLSSDSDLSDYASWLNDQETTRYMESGNFPLSVDALKDYIDSLKNSSDAMLLGIFTKKSQKHIGNITLRQFDRRNSHAEIGVIIGDRESRGKGYATEAIRLLADHAFYQLNLHKVSSGMAKGNEGSKKAFEKAGFKVEGVLREHFYLDGTYLDCYRMGLLKSEYRRIKD
jgi:RimJ/RimL family protein N-acetyltransferase